MNRDNWIENLIGNTVLCTFCIFLGYSLQSCALSARVGQKCYPNRTCDDGLVCFQNKEADIDKCIKREDGPR